MIDPDTLVAAQWWFRERKGDETDNRIVFLISSSFYFLHSLHSLMKDYSLPSISGIMSGVKKISDSEGIHLGMFPHSEKYASFRAAISLTGDIYNALSPILQHDLMELRPKIQNLYDAANKFRSVRNFFTHLGNVLREPEKHGVDGPLQTEFGAEYTDTAKNCFHLVMHNETIYFTYYKKAEKLYVGKSAFIPMFDAAREIYKELLSHKLNKEHQNYPPAESLFQINNGATK